MKSRLSVLMKSAVSARMNAPFVLCVFIGLVLFSCAAAAISWTADWEDVCGGCCVENHTVNFTVSIGNNGDSQFLVDSIRVELENGTVIATEGDIDGRGKTISPGHSKQFIPAGRLPITNVTPYYTVCIYAVYLSEDEITTLANWTCASDYSSMDTLPSYTRACDNDTGCRQDQYCRMTSGCESECALIIANITCGNFTNHTWVSYRCCLSADCASSQKCVNHGCVNITSCTCGQITNHECVPYECCSSAQCPADSYCSPQHTCARYECSVDPDCPSDKKCQDRKCIAVPCSGCNYAVDHACKPYTCCDDNACGSDETCVSHACARLACANDEYPTDHLCLKYECMESADCSAAEKCDNHKCAALSCRDYERVGNHTCAPLDCSLLDYPKRHQCVSYFSGEGFSDNPLPILLVISVALLLVILLYLKTKMASKAVPICQKCGRKFSEYYGSKTCSFCGGDVSTPPKKEHHKKADKKAVDAKVNQEAGKSGKGGENGGKKSSDSSKEERRKRHHQHGKDSKDGTSKDQKSVEDDAAEKADVLKIKKVLAEDAGEDEASSGDSNTSEFKL